MKRTTRKTLTILFFLFLTFVPVKETLACQCMGPNFRDSDTESAVKEFLSSKLGVEESEIINFEKKNSKGFLTAGTKFIIGIIEKIEGEIPNCERNCASWSNEKADFNIEYHYKNKICMVQLKTKMTSNLLNSGFKSVVTKKHFPKCL